MQKPQPAKKIPPNEIEPAYTTAPLTIPGTTLPYDRQEFLRLPKAKERDALFNLSRSTWNSLILPCKENNFRPPVKSLSLRRPGTQRGVRLIVVSSARAYFARLIEEADSDAGSGAERKRTASTKSRKSRATTPRT